MLGRGGRDRRVDIVAWRSVRLWKLRVNRCEDLELASLSKKATHGPLANN